MEKVSKDKIKCHKVNNEIKFVFSGHGVLGFSGVSQTCLIISWPRHTYLFKIVSSMSYSFL